jgi:iron complex transport system ATP-binding protein
VTRLSAHGLEVTIAGKTVCRDLDLDLEPGQCWGLLGVNGVGKTTLLHTLAGLRPPAAGQLLLDDAAMATLPRRHIAQQLGLLQQEDVDAFPATVLETALLGRHPYLGRWQWETAADEARATAALAQVGLAGLEQRRVDTLSGGERRRLALATLLTQDPRWFLLDEPTNHLDPHHQLSLLALLTAQVRDAGRGLLMILHDVNLATRFCDHVILLFGEGEARCGPVAEVLDTTTLERLYGHPMLALAGPNGPVYLPR